MKKTVYWTTYDTKVGKFHIAATTDGIINLQLPGLDTKPFFSKIKKLGQLEEKKTEIINQACIELDEYFLRKRKIFDVPIDLRGTEFQEKIWKYLLTIPYGKTVSYSEIAQNTGNLKAVRAIGMANRTNNIPIIIPCHRVVGKNGKLTGYGGSSDIGGPLLNFKQHLLDLESSTTPLLDYLV